MLRSVSVALVCAGLLVAAPLCAAEPPPATAEQQRAAAEHFRKARELYQQGQYNDARGELLKARALDPDARDLVFNLGIVAEKLQEYEEAIGYFQQYEAMPGVTEEERERAEAIIRRIEGARTNRPKPTEPARTSTPPRPERSQESERGRIDALTIGGLALTGAAAATGAVFGVLALQSKPADGVATGSSQRWQDVNADNDRARTFGIVADVGFGVAVGAAIATTVLYFARPKAVTPTQNAHFTPGGWRLQF